MSKIKEATSQSKASKQMKQAPNMKRMWELAFTKKPLVITACVLAVISTLVSFVCLPCFEMSLLLFLT